MREKLQLKDQMRWRDGRACFLQGFLNQNLSFSSSLLHTHSPSQDTVKSVDAHFRSEMHSEAMEVYASVGQIGQAPQGIQYTPSPPQLGGGSVHHQT